MTLHTNLNPNSWRDIHLPPILLASLLILFAGIPTAVQEYRLRNVAQSSSMVAEQLRLTQKALLASQQTELSLSQQLAQTKADATLMSACLVDVQRFSENAQTAYNRSKAPSVNWRVVGEQFWLAALDLSSFTESWQTGACSQAKPIIQNYK
ncbi:hypothetical protein HPC62_14490 [Thermoleptolyngbya sichuanensis A183]|uniref:Uncharacterized protein n=1 Tax=Thermoleptolyngbya sichuanensis A183 TaxID=2737172 RepID=A0A6M8BB42_9CYAN|nr:MULTISPECIES: hypothetical protein [Thermoleptolyngbya]QKD83242.1 hypothetical protein HPC62_14490 [Thermoleptolyngbya sichuanensis A183]